jgi:hypothetical protein
MITFHSILLLSQSISIEGGKEFFRSTFAFAPTTFEKPLTAYLGNFLYVSDCSFVRQQGEKQKRGVLLKHPFALLL